MIKASGLILKVIKQVILINYKSGLNLILVGQNMM